MKKFLLGLVGVLALMSTAVFAAPANANWNNPNNTNAAQPAGAYSKGYHTQGKNMELAYNGSCRWVGGYWRYGKWHPARKVCYGYGRSYHHNCRWVGGYWRHGYWHPKHKVCW